MDGYHTMTENARSKISCQNPHFPKSCDMRDKSTPQIEKVDFHLKYCNEVEVSEITPLGNNIDSLFSTNSSMIAPEAH